MRRFLLGGLVLAAILVVAAPASAEEECEDIHETFAGTGTGAPDESAGMSKDAETHSLDIGSSSCRITGLHASLTSSATSISSPLTEISTADAELAVSWKNLEVAASRTPGSDESIHLEAPPHGVYNFEVEQWASVDAPYKLKIDAVLAANADESGPNADQETVVIALPDSGINPYHDEFSEDTYPGDLNLQEHPSNYLESYPGEAQRLDLSLEADYWGRAVGQDDWQSVEEKELYWIPGTKIIGAYDDGSSVGTRGEDPTPILDDPEDGLLPGHGTRSASVAAGNTLGACERCLIVAIEGLFGFEWALQQPWIDIVSNSWTRHANAGTPNGPTDLSPGYQIGLDDGGDASNLRAAVSRGQTVLFAAGNGNAQQFLTPEQTYLSPYTGPDWTMTVGATYKFDDEEGSRDEGIVLASGKPVDISSYGWGDIPAADHASTDGHSQHAGTSAATPIAAGVMGQTLWNARDALNDTTSTTRNPVVAQGPATNGGLLDDGELTRAELEQAIKLTAQHTRNGWIGTRPLSVPTFPLPNEALPALWAAEGWGVVAERTGANATDVILGDQPLPERPHDQRIADADEANREALWGPAVEP